MRRGIVMSAVGLTVAAILMPAMGPVSGSPEGGPGRWTSRL